MEYRQLGNTGCRVSAIILGCGNFGGVGSHPAFIGRGETEEEAFTLLDRAFALGINALDTADAYGGGRSEEIIGHWLRAKGSGVRDRLLISTKTFNATGDGPNDWGLSRVHIMRHVERSLQRLGVDAIDLYLAHEPDRTTPIDETLRALDDLVRHGKVRYLGASNMPAWRTALALWSSDKHGLHRFEWIQNSFSLLERGDERELFPLLEDQKLGYTPFSPLAGGWLAGVYRAGQPFPPGSRMALRPEPYRHYERPEVFDRLAKLDAWARARGLSMASAALAWVLGHPRVTAAIVGPSRPEHFEPIEQALPTRLDADARRELDGLFPPILGA
jgi:aryl-alcohol dehydrogenase-like predicted oxidoreductase